MNMNELNCTIEYAKNKFKRLKKDFTILADARLIFTYGGYEIGINSSARQLIEEMEGFFEDDSILENMWSILKKIESIEEQLELKSNDVSLKNQYSNLLTEFCIFKKSLAVKDRVKIAVQHYNRPHGVVWKMRQDNALSSELLSKTTATINVSLGTVSSLYKESAAIKEGASDE